jgi:hypothetical protein
MRVVISLMAVLENSGGVFSPRLHRLRWRCTSRVP